MLANRMTDDSSDSNESKKSPHEHSSEPHVVVACPSCKTRFAVESGLIASYETPKFHCSRCDLVFQLTHSPKHALGAQTQAHNLPDTAQRWVLSDDAPQRASNPFSQPRPDASVLKPSDFTLGEATQQRPSNTRLPFAPLEERAGLSLLGLRPSAGQAISSSVTRLATVGQNQAPIQHPATVPPSGKPAAEERNSDPFSLFDPPSSASTPQSPLGSSEPTPPATQSLKSPLPAATAQVATPAPPPQKHTSTRAESLDTAEPLSRSTGGTAARMSLPSRVSHISSRLLNRLSVRNRGLVQMGLPVALLFATCCVTSYVTSFAPRTSDSFFRAIVPSLITGKVAVLPPAELQVQDVTIDFEKTQSKETIPVIRGVVQNSGAAHVEDVLIEALGFNSHGEIVTRAKAPLWSALGREKIGDIPLTTVKKYQASLRAPSATIRGGERVAFTVALLSEPIAQQDIAYFSARIFSVGRSRR